MGLTNYGTVHLFGVDDTVSNATVSDLSFDDVCANMQTVVDEIGNVIERRFDDLTTSGTIVLIIRASYTAPLAGAVFTLSGTDWQVTGVGRKFNSRGFQVTEIRILNSEYCLA